jgi:hypothetical protein
MSSLHLFENSMHPNQHAEAIKENMAAKKRRLGSPSGPINMSSPTSLNNVTETLEVGIFFVS